MLGTWANANGGTRNVADIVVSPGGTGINVDGFGACSPVNCQWGNVRATVYGSTVSSPTGNSFEATWNFGFSRTVLLAKLTQLGFVPVLVVQEFTTFTDHSGRANFEVTGSFVRAGTIFPTRIGTVSFGYPLGDSVYPSSALVGVWFNTSPGGGNIRKIIISLAVRAFGNCVPVLCAWGRSPGSRSAPASRR